MSQPGQGPSSGTRMQPSPLENISIPRAQQHCALSLSGRRTLLAHPQEGRDLLKKGS